MIKATIETTQRFNTEHTEKHRGPRKESLVLKALLHSASTPCHLRVLRVERPSLTNRQPPSPFFCPRPRSPTPGPLSSPFSLFAFQLFAFQAPASTPPQ
jgi:hypothetical protein